MCYLVVEVLFCIALSVMWKCCPYTMDRPLCKSGSTNVYCVSQVVGNSYISHQQWKVLIMCGMMTLFHVIYCIFARNLAAKHASVT
jgi:hypothetical protein